MKISKIAVQDANVIIDLELASLLDLWFQAGVETHTTDLIKYELEDGEHQQALAYFQSGHIIEHELSADELFEVSALEIEVNSKAKFNDCSVLYLSRKIGAMLISGDKPLRRAGKDRHIEVHGTLWIFDLLVDEKLITPKLAAAKLRHLLDQKRFLPKAECEARLSKWSK